MNAHPQRVLIVGGGICGISLATSLAVRGIEPVVCTEQSTVPASERSYAWLNASLGYDKDYRALRHRAMAYITAKASRDEDLRHLTATPGTLYFALSEEAESYRAEFDELEGTGGDARWLDPHQILKLEPRFTTGQVAGGFVVPHEGYIELDRYTSLLRSRLEHSRVKVIPHAFEPADFENLNFDGSEYEVSINGAAARFSQIVIAAGHRTSQFLAPLGCEMQDASSLGSIVRTSPVDHMPKHVLHGRSITFRGVNGGQGLLIHSSAADASLEVDDDGIVSSPEGLGEAAIAETRELFDMGNIPEPEKVQTGWRPIPEDGRPVLGELPNHRGIFALHTHSGATLGPYLGDLLARELVGEGPQLIDSYRPARFLRKETV